MDQPVPGAQSAFPEQYVREFAARLMARAITYAPDRAYEDAADRVQETFTRMIKKWPDNAEALANHGIAYAYRVLKNLTIDDWKSARNRHEVLGLEPASETVADMPRADEVLSFSERQREVWRAVATLDQTLQELILLVYVDEQSVSEAGRNLGLASSTAARYHNRALLQLRKLIEPDMEEAEDDA